MLLSGVRNSWDMLARNSDLYFDVSASSLGLLFERPPRMLDFLVLALHFHVPLGKLLRFQSQLVVRLLQLSLLCLQFAGQLLRLLEQGFCLHRRFDRVQHDADAACQLLQESYLQIGERSP